MGNSWAGMRRALPSDDADELTWLLFRQEDVLSLQQARAHLTRRAIRHRVTTGRWRQAHRAVLVAHNGPVGPGQLRWIAVLAAGPTALLGGMTAAQEGGLRGFPQRVVHLLLPATTRRSPLPSGVLAHRTTHLPDSDVVPIAAPPRTAAARSIVDAAQWAPTDTRARAIVAAAFQQRLVGGDDVHEVVERMPRIRRRRLILSTATDAAGGAHSWANSTCSISSAVPACPNRAVRWSAGTPPAGGATSTRTSSSGACTSRWTAGSTSIRRTPGRTCGGRTTCGSRATVFSGSPPGPARPSRRGGRLTPLPCGRPAGRVTASRDLGRKRPR
ncbi:hypothetical protein V2I01_16415 [Micromonospora sp. BRA006-A]|nr:hypothetical protein [Micromonospora sp. BRA006-A]